MHSVATALRTACITGTAERQLGQAPDPNATLTSRDVDQAVAGLLGNGLAASDAAGITVPAGFNRIAAFHAGLTTDHAEECYPPPVPDGTRVVLASAAPNHSCTASILTGPTASVLIAEIRRRWYARLDTPAADSG